MSAAARRKSRQAGEKQGHRRETGRTPAGAYREAIERQIAEQGETDRERLMWDRYDD